ncbi:MAG: arginine--tRNA ligase [Deltaproteobacteria bacterium]|jgi:arginyl-tRNA synthetase|nr:arginine--tRNA ligase [Deltaproteobacteria bacterium]
MIKIKSRLNKIFKKSLKKLIENNELPEILQEKDFVFSSPKMKVHGDLATNFALASAKIARMSPRKLASLLVDNLQDTEQIISDVEIAGPGFINVTLDNYQFLQGMERILLAGKNWGKSSDKNEKINLEFVSANPTGPLHVGHGRGAAVGDALARIMKTAGYDVSCEYYLNDAGNQVDNLALSIWFNYLQICREQGREIPEIEFPQDGYHGEYIKEMATDYFAKKGCEAATNEYDAEELKKFGVAKAVEKIKTTLKKLGVEFDRFYSENELHNQGKIETAIKKLQAKGVLYQQEGALFFKSSEFEDSKDRVVIKSDGSLTYFAADIAYHADKLERGFDKMIDIWGADHHGYIPRIKSSLTAMGYSSERFEALLVQFVSLISKKKKVSMGKRSGNFVELNQLIDEVGADVTRWYFIAKSHDSALDFDLNSALSMDPKENSARYAQYGHARACSILKKVKSKFALVPGKYSPELARELGAAEINLLKFMLELPEVILNSAQSREIHHVAAYLVELSRNFHSYYTTMKDDPILPRKDVLTAKDENKVKARLIWLEAFRTVARNALEVLGLPAPEQMESPKEVQ